MHSSASQKNTGYHSYVAVKSILPTTYISLHIELGTAGKLAPVDTCHQIGGAAAAPGADNHIVFFVVPRCFKVFDPQIKGNGGVGIFLNTLGLVEGVGVDLDLVAGFFQEGDSAIAVFGIGVGSWRNDGNGFHMGGKHIGIITDTSFGFENFRVAVLSGSGRKTGGQQKSGSEKKSFIHGKFSPYIFFMYAEVIYITVK